MSKVFDKLWDKLKPEQRFTNPSLAAQGVRNLIFFGFKVTDEKCVGSIWDTNMMGGIAPYRYTAKQAQALLYDFLESDLDLQTWMRGKENKHI